MSPVRIADELNARGVPGPRGRSWQGTASRGDRNRGSGILNNQAISG
ncbi:recombinase family protein [Neorhizobium sp. T786]|nr:recombinase family protein [Neorhizobium xiangyangii]